MTDNLLSRRASARQAARVEAPAAPAAPQPKEAGVNKEAKLAAIREDAQRRVAAAWTTAKTLLPGLSAKAQQHLAAALVAAPTAVLAETLKATARMAHHSRGAAKFAEATGRELNEFVEDEGLLNKLNTEVLAENKKDDGNKVAADNKTAAPGDPTNLDQQETPAPAEQPGEGTPEGAPEGAQGEFQEPAPQAPEPGAMGDPGAGVDAPAPANAVADVAEEGDLLANIENVEREIGEIQSEVEEAGDEALDLASIFNPEVQADKAQSLANEGEGAAIPMDEMGGDDFAPSGLDDMMNAADLGAPEGDMTNPQDFFKGASLDPMAALFGKQAAGDSVDVEEGGMDAHFRTDLAGDGRDAETDNEDLLGEVLSTIPQPTMEQKRDTQDKLEEPAAPQAKEAGAKPQAAAPAAAKPKSSIRTVGAPAQPKQAAAEGKLDIDSLLFGGRD